MLARRYAAGMIKTWALVLGTMCMAASGQESTPPTDASADEPIAFDLEKAKGVGPAFLKQGHTRLTIGSGIAFPLESDDDSTDYNLNVTWSRFIVDDIELRVEAGLWYFDQDEDEAFGFNPNIVFRWHLFEHERLTVYADAGIGVLASSDDVPVGGTSFNLMPRAGGGITYGLGDGGQRLELGVRWHHISNARFSGDSDNPDRDGVMIYAGFSFPL